MTDLSHLYVNLGAISHNMNVIQATVGPHCGICPVVKADAYGLGAGQVSRRLVASGAEMLAVYTPGQAAELFAKATGVPILVLSPLREVERAGDLYRGLICGQLHLAVHDAAHLAALVALTERFGVRLNVHLMIDTGLGVGGCRLAEAPAILARIAAEPRLVLAGVFTHFASADHDMAFTNLQLERFEQLLDGEQRSIGDDCIVHAANTYAMFRRRQFHKSMVRVGLAWAGFGVERMRDGRIDPRARDLEPCVTWTSRLTNIRTVEEGEGVGYGRLWTARRPTRLGVVPVGYADGYPAALAGHNGRTDPAHVVLVVPTPDGAVRCAAPVVGSIHMDQITIDLTDIERECPSAAALAPNTPVELISADADAPNHLARLATGAGALPHAILCGLNARIKRTFIDQPVEVHTTPGAGAAVAARRR